MKTVRFRKMISLALFVGAMAGGCGTEGVESSTAAEAEDEVSSALRVLQEARRLSEGQGVRFAIVIEGVERPAFAVRYRGVVRGYLALDHAEFSGAKSRMDSIVIASIDPLTSSEPSLRNIVCVSGCFASSRR